MLTPLTSLLHSGLMVAGAALATLLLNRALHPLLVRYALARPNARSSHKVPTPQGGGIGVIGVTLVAFVALAVGAVTPGIDTLGIVLLTGGALMLAGVGAVDDIHPLPVIVRLALQFIAAGLIVSAVPPDLMPLARYGVPAAAEYGVLVLGLVWFINLTNFMDGIDGITVVEMVPILAALALFAHLGALPKAAGLMALLLGGALIGFAPANRHVAKLFLGDVGSLPIGGLVGWLLIVLAGVGHIAAALILPMYYLADSGITLWRRWRRGETVWQAHRSHYYQRALDAGLTVPEVTTIILRLNLALVVLAFVTIKWKYLTLSVAALVGAAVLTWLTLQKLERGKP